MIDPLEIRNWEDLLHNWFSFLVTANLFCIVSSLMIYSAIYFLKRNCHPFLPFHKRMKRFKQKEKKMRYCISVLSISETHPNKDYSYTDSTALPVSIKLFTSCIHFHIWSALILKSSWSFWKDLHVLSSDKSFIILYWKFILLQKHNTYLIWTKQKQWRKRGAPWKEKPRDWIRNRICCLCKNFQSQYQIEKK